MPDSHHGGVRQHCIPPPPTMNKMRGLGSSSSLLAGATLLLLPLILGLKALLATAAALAFLSWLASKAVGGCGIELERSMEGDVVGCWRGHGFTMQNESKGFGALSV